MKYIKSLNILPLSVQESLQSTNLYPQEKHGRTYSQRSFMIVVPHQESLVTDFSLPSPTAMILLLSPSHARSLLEKRKERDQRIGTDPTKGWASGQENMTYTRPEMTLYSPFTICSSPTTSQMFTKIRSRSTFSKVTHFKTPTFASYIGRCTIISGRWYTCHSRILKMSRIRSC